MADLRLLREYFLSSFPDVPRSEDLHLFFCPGRINLIGEHIDYNGGPVFPMAVAQGIYAVVRFTGDDRIRLSSVGQRERGEFTVDEVPPFSHSSFSPELGWLNYPLAMISSIKQTDAAALSGADVSFWSDLPVGAGLSSSAAMEVLTGFLFRTGAEGKDVDKKALALEAQRAEQQYVGVNCGIMDQFSVAMGMEHHAILLDCATLDYRYIPFDLTSHSLVIMNTRRPRTLAGSKYNERRAECDAALKALNDARKAAGRALLPNLCAATEAEVMTELTDATLRKRARHVTSERARVEEAVRSLEKGDLRRLGELLNASHDSLQRDYAVTGEALDAIVSAAREFHSCLGARMTGAGFGGCAIALVPKSDVPAFVDAVAEQYETKMNQSAEFLLSESVGGVQRLPFA